MMRIKLHDLSVFRFIVDHFTGIGNTDWAWGEQDVRFTWFEVNGAYSLFADSVREGTEHSGCGQ